MNTMREIEERIAASTEDAFVNVSPPARWPEAADPEWVRDWRENRRLKHQNILRRFRAERGMTP